MNKLFKALIYNNEVSLSVMDTTELVNKAIKIHSLNAKSAITLGGFLTCAVFMAGCLKSDRGAISITVKGDEQCGSISVSGDKDLHIRGYIDGTGEGKLKGGTLTVIKEDGFFRPFMGTCELKCDDVSENLMQYFHKSEQVETAVAIRVKMADDGTCQSAGGVVMQLLPGTSEESMEKAENMMQNFVDYCSVLEKLGADGIINEYFKDEINEKTLYLYSPDYVCNCSRHKIEGVLLSVPKQELKDIIKEQGNVSVHCHYCNTDYVFDDLDIENLFNKG